MKLKVGFAVMIALALFGCATAEQQQVDADRYEQLHAAALTLATKVDRGEMSREEATLQLVQMESMNSDDQHKAAVQGAATEAPVAASMLR